MLIAVTLFPEAAWAVLSRSVIALESKRCQTEPARVGDALPVADDQVGGRHFPFAKSAEIEGSARNEISPCTQRNGHLSVTN